MLVKEVAALSSSINIKTSSAIKLIQWYYQKIISNQYIREGRPIWTFYNYRYYSTRYNFFNFNSVIIYTTWIIQTAPVFNWKGLEYLKGMETCPSSVYLWNWPV